VKVIVSASHGVPRYLAFHESPDPLNVIFPEKHIESPFLRTEQIGSRGTSVNPLDFFKTERPRPRRTPPPPFRVLPRRAAKRWDSGRSWRPFHVYPGGPKFIKTFVHPSELRENDSKKHDQKEN